MSDLETARCNVVVVNDPELVWRDWLVTPHYAHLTARAAIKLPLSYYKGANRDAQRRPRSARRPGQRPGRHARRVAGRDALNRTSVRSSVTAQRPAQQDVPHFRPGNAAF